MIKLKIEPLLIVYYACIETHTSTQMYARRAHADNIFAFSEADLSAGRNLQGKDGKSQPDRQAST